MFLEMSVDIISLLKYLSWAKTALENNHLKLVKNTIINQNLKIIKSLIGQQKLESCQIGNFLLEYK